MARYEIIGGIPLQGEVTISGAKNAAVAILPAALLVSGTCRIENVPDISDVRILVDILRDLGAKIEYEDRNTLVIDSTNITGTHPNPALVRKMRASYYLMGVLLGRFGHADVALPGGCNFASRPIDQHIKGFLALGADVEETDDYVLMQPGEDGLRGAKIMLDMASVGATANIMMAAVLNFLGAMISTGVAKTIGGDIVVGHIEQPIIIASLVGAIIWNLLTWKIGLPSSSSHALVGGMIGGVLMSDMGLAGLNFAGIGKIVIALVTSPLLGMVMGYIIMTVLFRVFENSSPSKLNHRFKKMQIVTAATMAFSHGSNDAQKSMGIITLALFSGGVISEFEVPTIVKILAATAMAVGTSLGGWSIIKTVGGKIFKLEPVNGFAADLNSSITIFTATMLHLPVSTTHVVSGSIMGVGAAKRIHAVRWGVAQQMVMAWVLTIPCTAAMGALSYVAVMAVFG